jgi:hypothetical protein
MMGRMSDRDAWEVLGLDEAAAGDSEQLQKAYRKRAKEAHPDAGGDREAWDDLAEAYALLAAQGQHMASDQPENPGVRSRIVWAWRGWSKYRRLGVVLVVGAVLTWAVWSVMGVQPMWQVRLVMTLYAAGWWVWWIVTQMRRPAVRPQTWVIVPDPPFFRIQVVDSPGMVK